MAAELRTEAIDGESWTEHRARVYCRQCERDTHPAAETMPLPEDSYGMPRCWTCGEEYACDECGSSLLVGHDGTAVCIDDDAH